METTKINQIANSEINNSSSTIELLTQLLNEMGSMREVIARQEIAINQLQSELAQTRACLTMPETTTPANATASNASNQGDAQSHHAATPLNVNRRRLLKGLAAGLAATAGATVALSAVTKDAQAKLIVNPIPVVGAIVTLPGIGYTKQPINTDNRYGLIASAGATAFDLETLPDVASVGVYGYTPTGAGVWGKSASGWGVRGEGDATGFGVSGTATGNGIGIGGGSDTGYGVYAFSASGIPLFIEPTSTPPVVPQGIFFGGLYVNQVGDVFTLVAGAWKKLTREA